MVKRCPGVAKSVCHRDRRSLSSRQLRRLCRTDFGSPIHSSPWGGKVLRSVVQIRLSVSAKCNYRCDSTIYPFGL